MMVLLLFWETIFRDVCVFKKREVALPNRQGHTCAPWAASGRGQLGCWAESHHHGV